MSVCYTINGKYSFLKIHKHFINVKERNAKKEEEKDNKYQGKYA